MDYYDIISLIVFWHKESIRDFPVLRHVVRIIDDKSIAEVDKGDMIVDLLRENGLYELGHEDITFSEGTGELMPEEPTTENNSIEVPVQVVTVKLMNAEIEVGIILN